LRIVIDQPPHQVAYDCDGPDIRAVERAVAPGARVAVWYEPTLTLPASTPELWQLRVDGRTVLSHEQVAVAHRARAVPTVLFYLLFTGVGLVFGAIGVGAFLEVFRPRRD
jgi:hypothetical protein